MSVVGLQSPKRLPLIVFFHRVATCAGSWIVRSWKPPPIDTSTTVPDLPTALERLAGGAFKDHSFDRARGLGRCSSLLSVEWRGEKKRKCQRGRSHFKLLTTGPNPLQVSDAIVRFGVVLGTTTGALGRVAEKPSRAESVQAQGPGKFAGLLRTRCGRAVDPLSNTSRADLRELRPGL